MKYILSLIISGALVVSSFGQTRNVLVNTNNAVVQPTNFWSADAANARAGLGIGSAATNPATAFQPASTNLTLLANGDGSSLTNLNLSGLGTINISNVSGLQSALDGKLATNGSAADLTSFPATILQTTSALTNFPAGLLRNNGDGSGLTNLPIPAVASNVLSTIGLDKGGTGATNASGARINLGGTTIGINIFTATDAETVKNYLGLGWSALTNTNASDFRDSIGLNTTNNVVFQTISSQQAASSGVYNITLGQTNTGFRGIGAGPSDFGYYRDGSLVWHSAGSGFTFSDPVFFGSDVAQTRTNLGLPWSGLTNTTPAGFRSALELGTTNAFTIGSITSPTITAQNITITAGGGITLQAALTNASSFRTNIGLPWTGLTNSSASSFRTALELGTAATNSASAFQSSSATLSNLATANGGSLTNLQATNLVGVIPSSNIATVNFSNLAGTLSIASGGTGATNAANARQNLGSTTVGDAVFIATNAAAARTAIGALASNGSAAGLTGFVGTTNAATARTNLGLGWSALTNTDTTSFRNAIGIGTTNDVTFNSINLEQTASSAVYSLTLGQTNTGFRGIGGGPSDFGFYRDGSRIWSASGAGLNIGVESSFSQPLTFSYGAGSLGYIDFSGVDPATGAAISRTNLGLPWSGLTNTNAATFQAALFGANTNPVLVNTNGEVVSPTNFWQAAPIATTLQNSEPNATNTAATNARLLFLFSLVPTTTGVTNTVTLPTNGSTFNGDVATITHNAPTSSVTAIRQLGASTNLITLNQPDETVRFLYRDNQWELMDNISYIEPIYFSGTNAAANAAASRTNLGLGATNTVFFKSLTLTEDGGFSVGTIGTNSLLFSITQDGIAIEGSPSGPVFELIGTNIGPQILSDLALSSTNNVAFRNITSDGNIVISNQSATNNGILFVYRTNNEPFLGLANLIASNNTTVGNETLFRVGAAEATNKAAQFGFRSTNTNGDGVAVFSTFGYNALMMVGPSDRSRTNYATNTNAGIEADIWSISPTNRVATLIDTNTGAFSLHRAIQFQTNDSSVGNTNLVPATNNQISKWLRVYIGTNTFYLPLYQ